MKKLSPVLAGIFFLLTSLNAVAQPKTGAMYFAGKWNVLVKGTPGGDSRMLVVLDKKDSTLAGAVQDTTGNEISKISRVDLGDTTATVYFTAQGYDVSLVMNKKDDDHIIGSVLGMFDAEGDRVKTDRQTGK